MKLVSYINTIGVLALATLCAWQWQANRRANPLFVPMQETPQPIDSQREAQTRLPLVAAEASQRPDSVAASIGRARAELREILGLLSFSAPQPVRSRARLASVTSLSGTLFPS